MEDFCKTTIQDLNIIMGHPTATLVLGVLLGLFVIILVGNLFSYIAERKSKRVAIYKSPIGEDDTGSVSGSNHSQQLGVVDPASLMYRKSFLDELHYASQKSNKQDFATRCIELLQHVFQPALLAEVINHPLQPHLFTPFHRACMNGNDILITYMLKKGADIHLTAATGDAPMHFAVFGLITNAYGDLSPLETLFQHGAALNAVKNHGYTPLHLVAKHGNMRTICWLIEKGADPEAKTTCGKTPSDEAAAAGHTEAARYLRVNVDRVESCKISASCPSRVERRTKYRNPGSVSQDLFHTTDEESM